MIMRNLIVHQQLPGRAVTWTVIAFFGLVALGYGPSFAQSAFDFSFSFGSGVTASGEFIASATATPGQFLVTGISGNINFGAANQAMTLLPVNSFGGNDNILYYPDSASVDVAGISFSAGPAGSNYNLYEYNGQTLLCACEYLGDPNATNGNLTTNPAPGPIPGVGLLSYMVLAMLGLGSASWQKWRGRLAAK